MLTLIPECELSKSGTSFFRSVIDGLSTDPSVIVVVPPPPPPPPAPEQATATRTRTRPATSVTADLGFGRWSGERSFLSVMERLPLNYATYRPGSNRARQRCHKTTLSVLSQIRLDCNRRNQRRLLAAPTAQEANA